MGISRGMILTLVATEIINKYIKQNDKDEDLLTDDAPDFDILDWPCPAS